MGITLLLLLIEVLTLAVIRQHYYDRSWMRYYFFITVNSVLSIWLWVLWFRIMSFRGAYDEQVNMWVLMNFRGMAVGLVIPRVIMIISHYAGRIKNRGQGTHNRVFTNTGISLAAVMMLIITAGTFYGRYNFRTEYHEIVIRDLSRDLDGLRIVHISDLHLTSFYHRQELLDDLMKRINELEPDILVNTGDFVNVGWREAGRFDTILAKASARYGKYAIMGNHDFGTYNPFFTEADMEINSRLIKRFIEASGYRVLNDEFTMLKIGEAGIALAGVNTKGSFPDIIHGDLEKALEGIYGADLKILLAHDPNQWDLEIAGKTDVDITLSGHTHGMQIGIMTEKIKWSPARYFYPRWGGLYREGDQYLVVTRGLGVMGMPFRIGMPPEITVITLKKEP
ncbi:MAG TPA: metallophosphoesterase [Bacteroidales bacterium]|nr:metallophosphoesterase [Bacteroidales bacterium]